jgi:ABC-type antimicrobial peptide transport system permease subunit
VVDCLRGATSKNSWHIYSVISYAMSQRRQEIGIRMALEASPRELQRSVLGQTLKLASAGILLGLVISWLIRCVPPRI